MEPSNWRRMALLTGLPAGLVGALAAWTTVHFWHNPLERFHPLLTFLVVAVVAAIADFFELEYGWRRYFGNRPYHDLQRSGQVGLGIVGPVSMSLAFALLATWAILFKIQDGI